MSSKQQHIRRSSITGGSAPYATGLGPLTLGAIAALALGCSGESPVDAESSCGRRQQALTASTCGCVADGSDDAEESSSGSMSLSSSDLELVTDGFRGAQKVGMRFTGVGIPAGATINSAYIEFTVDETNSGTTNLSFRAQDADNPGTFSLSSNNISNRTLTSTSVSWSPSAWNTVGQKHQSPDLSSVVQQVVDRGGWSSGNAMVFVVTGSGERTAESYDGVSSSAALLHVEYDTDGSGPSCGDGTCNGGETCSTCSADCGACGGGGSGGAGGSGGTGGSGGGDPTDPNLLVAFIGDQGNNGNSTDVLQLIAAEGADAVVHNGDFDYQDNPAAWESRINSVLGANYPYFAVVGNHDAAAWHGTNGYGARIADRVARVPDMQCSGTPGVQANCTFRGLQLVQSCVGTNELSGFSCGANSSTQVNFIGNALASSSAIFKICSWHKNQHDMQVGTKGNEVGWNAYQTCMNNGGIVSTGHEHSYSRTLTLTDLGNAGNGHGATGAHDFVTVGSGETFVFVSGLAGVGIRSYSANNHDDDTWWSSYYASNRWVKNGVNQGGSADYGALFIRFNVSGNDRRATAYFKDVNGRMVDEFTIDVQ